MKRLRSMSLGAKLNLSLLAFLLLLGAATSAIIIFGFNRTQDSAQERSNEALEEQGKLALQALIGGVTEQGGVLFEIAGETGRQAALYLESQQASAGSAPVDTSALVRTESGLYYDPNPDRASDLVLLNGSSPDDPAVQSDLALSAPLNDILPVLFQGFTGEVAGQNFDPTAMIFIGTSGASRYYPPIGVQNLLPPEVDIANRLDSIGPVNNPDRRTIWTAPYEDAGGQGQIVTARTPVYVGDTLRGSLEVDLSIANLIDQVNQIKPTPGGFAFYVDSTGALFETQAHDLITTEATQHPDVAAMLDGMRANKLGDEITVLQVQFGGEEFFVAYAPLLTLGGSFAVAAPVSDVTANAATITAGIEDEGTRTFWIMLAAMAVLFVAGLAAAGYLNRQAVIKPIGSLVAATRAVAAGDLSAQVPVSNRGDEFGELGESFNSMVEQLRESERMLEGRVEARTRELQALLETSKALSSTLELRPLLDEILDQLKTLVDCAGASVLLLQDGKLVQLAVRRPASSTAIEEEPTHRPTTSVIWDSIKQGTPVVIDDMQEDSVLAREYRGPSVATLEGTPLAYIRAWAAVPIVARDEVIGMLAMAHEMPGGFDAHDIELAGAVAAQAAVAIQNAELYERTKVQATETEALLRADAELFQTLSLDSVLQALVDVTVDVLGADKSIVILHEGDIDAVRAARNYAPGNIASYNRILAGMPHEEPPPAGQVAQTYTDVHQSPDFISEALLREGIASHTSIPIKDRDRMLGLFGVSFVEEHTFTVDEQRLYVALADRAAVAIQNAELYERAQQAASLEERQRLARELHDSVSQALFGIALGAQTARLRLDNDPATAIEPVEYVMSLAQAGLAEMRALIFELRPESLETEGLVAALEKQVAATQARHNIPIEIEVGEEPDCRIEIKEALYRIAQEALNNVVKHAQASRVHVSLKTEADALALRVEDNGVGFDAASSYPGHVGLLSMPERAAKLGGQVNIRSSPEDGTRVEAMIPLAPDLRSGVADTAR